MKKTITLISFLITAQFLWAQQDTSWTSTIVLYHTRDIDVVSQVPVNYSIGLLQLTKGNHTVVGYIGHKSNGNLSGVQTGLDYYKKGNKGYYHLGIKQSKVSFYPSLSLEGNYYKTISKGLEIGLGYKHLTYDTNDISQTIVVSGFYYTGKWMLSYRGAYFNYSKLYHYGAARYIFSDYGMFIEANMSNGGEVISNHSQNELLVSSTSLGIKANYVFKKRYNLFAAYNHIYASQLEVSNNYNAYSVGVKIKL